MKRILSLIAKVLRKVNNHFHNHEVAEVEFRIFCYASEYEKIYNVKRVVNNYSVQCVVRVHPGWLYNSNVILWVNMHWKTNQKNQYILYFHKPCFVGNFSVFPKANIFQYFDYIGIHFELAEVT